jgi:hypothetical protein
MKHTLILLCAAISISLFSCQKEISIDNTSGGGGGGTGGGGNSSTLLVRSVYKQGSDSTVSAYTYDGAKRLASATYTGASSGAGFDLNTKLVRNSSGIIQKIILKSSDLVQFGLDSIVSNVVYDAGGSRYKGQVINLTVPGVFILKDSVIYEYDAAGKISRETDFFDDGSTSGYELYSKTEYTYTGNNLATMKFYSYDLPTKAYILENTIAYEYDAKTNPLQIGNEALLLNFIRIYITDVDVSTYSANNITKQTVTNPTDPTSNGATTITYTYNSTNRPITSTFVTTPGGGTASGTFFYQ